MMSSDMRQYSIITANYWAFTLTDGALRMLVVLYFHQLGYSPLDIAMLFLFYEFFGVVTNLFGGWLGSIWGLNRTMQLGLGLQILALSMLLVDEAWLTVIWIMAAQALSGIAKDLNKMSAKSSVKLLVDDQQQDQLYRWVAMLTGSKNTLKGVGFFLGGLLLTLLGFFGAVVSLLSGLLLVWLLSLLLLKGDIGRSKYKPKFLQIFSKNQAINRLSVARMFLFAARDVWFVVALPVFLSSQLNWNHWQVGGFLALWVIVYGMVQGLAPKLTGTASSIQNHKVTFFWCLMLAVVPFIITVLIYALQQGYIVQFLPQSDEYIVALTLILFVGLSVFGFLFAVNSSLHSYLILAYADRDKVSTDVGFYYMANAAGRLFGTVLSGLIFQLYGLLICLVVSSILLILSSMFVKKLDPTAGQLS